MIGVERVVAALVGGATAALVNRIQVGLVEETTAVPYVQIGVLGSEDENYLSGDTCYDWQNIQVRCYASTTGEAFTVVKSAKADCQSLGSFEGTQTGEDPETKRRFAQFLITVGSENT